ncbi:flagellar motor stator protein MotA [Trinickia caryophylli]|uniref:Chemotaxis protein MotA n=1 Tax=Trinickia caryophylli TaxID=28094 RepID=A0A1X7H6G3_TRICW|nr:flagellar motor stator protein MotA [Trinickia caryophylli]PMS13313.1 flagellar motor stator protein MotA [Trinickia caryophylli]TRX19158.1 flagellar motor stator protein MotA [Trinickia caryophylli]WQE13544.1 flagellar motor stator protein MotA [Trinickia caryophylli]SMF80378.1 chemotaxis protein MotA [Trinickia caryophylli]GLU33922.1 flagellar motor protein MotA [Trinickia caryophylli]
MFVVIGWVLVIGSIIGSFVGEGGHIAALIQPFELVCIFGAAIGAFVVSNPTSTLRKTLKSLPSIFRGGSYDKQKYLELIALLYELLQKARKEGMMALEADVDAPDQSPLFQKYPHIISDHHLRDFIIDYLRMMSTGNINVLEMQDLMDEELVTHHAEEAIAANAIQKMADGLPAFGIVAAVMGVVHTMGSVGAAPAVLGEMIAAALVGTFLGILLAYGFVGPVADLLNAKGRDAAKPFQCVKVVLLASLSGYAPPIAAEFGRKVLFTSVRPTFQELDDAVRATKVAAKPAQS